MGWQVAKGSGESRAGLRFVGLGAVRHAEVKVSVRHESGVLGRGVDDAVKVGHAGGGVVAVAVGRHDEESAQRQMGWGVYGVEVEGVVQGGAGRGEEIPLFEHAGGVGGAAHEIVGEADPGGRLIRQAFGGATGGGDGAAGVAAFGKFLGGGLERRNGRQLLTGC